MRADFPERAPAIDRYTETEKFRVFGPEQKHQAIEILRGAFRDARAKTTATAAGPGGTSARESRGPREGSRRRRKRSRR